MRLLLLLFLSFLFANAEEISFNYKLSNTNFTYNGQSPLDNRPYTYNYDRLRNDIDLGYGNKLHFKLICDLENFVGYSYLTSPEQKALSAAKFDLPLDPYHETIDEDEQLLRGYLYRAYLTAYLPRSSLTLGLQRIPLGVGKIWTPTDVINPLNPLALEKEERLGVYGVNYTYDLGDLAQLQAFFTQNRYGLLKDYGYLLKKNINSTDIGVSYVANKDQQLMGFDLEREIFATGIEGRFEYAWLDSELLDKKYEKYIFGVDYSFANSLYLAAEYFFNGAGDRNKEKYQQTIATGDWQQLGKDYFGLVLSYELTPLVQINGTTILNINDGSFSLAPALSWSLRQNMDLLFGTSLFCGEKYSEFGELPGLFYVSLSNYF